MVAEDKMRVELQLDKVSMLLLDNLLDAAGMTRAGFFNTLLVKTVEAMDLKSVPDIKKMTIPQLYKLLGGLGKMMSGK
jgi:hypothetical protein